MKTAGSSLISAVAVRSFWNGFLGQENPWSDLLFTRPSTQKTDTYTRLGAPPMPIAFNGDRRPKVVNEYNFSATNQFYELTVKVDKELILFQQWDEVAKLVGEIGEKTANLIPQLATTKIVSGSAALGDDGQNFFDTDHADPGAAYTTSQDNDLTSVAAAGDAIPTQLEFATAVRGCIDSLYGRKDDQGDPFTIEPIGPSNLVIMVPPPLATVARHVLVASSLTGPVGNDLQGQFELRVNRRMTTTSTVTTFYAFVKSASHKPLIVQEAQAMQPYEYRDPFSDDYYFGSSWNGTVDFGQWRTAVLHTFTT